MAKVVTALAAARAVRNQKILDAYGEGKSVKTIRRWLRLKISFEQIERIIGAAREAGDPRAKKHTRAMMAAQVAVERGPEIVRLYQLGEAVAEIARVLRIDVNAVKIAVLEATKAGQDTGLKMAAMEDNIQSIMQDRYGVTFAMPKKK